MTAARVMLPLVISATIALMLDHFATQVLGWPQTSWVSNLFTAAALVGAYLIVSGLQGERR